MNGKIANHYLAVLAKEAASLAFEANTCIEQGMDFKRDGHKVNYLRLKMELMDLLATFMEVERRELNNAETLEDIMEEFRERIYEKRLTLQMQEIFMDWDLPVVPENMFREVLNYARDLNNLLLDKQKEVTTIGHLIGQELVEKLSHTSEWHKCLYRNYKGDSVDQTNSPITYKHNLIKY